MPLTLITTPKGSTEQLRPPSRTLQINEKPIIVRSSIDIGTYGSGMRRFQKSSIEKDAAHPWLNKSFKPCVAKYIIK